MQTRHLLRSLFLAATLATVRVSAQSAPSAADAAVLRDTLFTGITFTHAQAQRILTLAREQRAEQDADRPVFMNAVSEIRRTRDRGDAAGAQAILAMVQQSATRRRDWWLGAMRAVLTPEQRRQFDVNLTAVSEEADVIGITYGNLGGSPQ